MSAEHLQQLLDHAAREMGRLHDWAERTSKDRDSRHYGYKDGRFDALFHIAGYIQGLADHHGLTLDETKLNETLERGDFL